MRRWRVGTISMGLTLVMLGVLLLVSQFAGWDVMTLSLSWWPAILIILGVEVLLFLAMSKQEKPVVQYDFVSILFIGILGTVGIGLYIFSSLGLVQEVKAEMDREQIEASLPTVEEQLSDKISTIVVKNPHNEELTIETNTERVVSLFGTFTSDFLNKEDLKEEELVNLHQVGDTLYVQLLEAPTKEGFRYHRTMYDRTLSLPASVDVEIREMSNHLTLNLGDVTGDWMVDRAGNVTIDVDPDANLAVKAESYSEDLGWDVNWDVEETIVDDSEDRKLYYMEKKYGDGSATIQVNLADSLTIKDVGPRS